MTDSRGVTSPLRALLGAGILLILSACGGTVREHPSGGSGGDGATGSGGHTNVSGAGSSSKGGRVSTGGKPGTGGLVGTGGRIGAGGAVGAGGAAGCKPGYTDCPDGCMNLESNPTHCGSCFRTCPSGNSCVNGICQGASQTCAAGTVFCSNFGECLDTKSNPFACGSCSTGCNGTRCTNGVCDPKSCISPTATFCASSGRCVELSSDYQNCGDCGKACDPAASCENGKCVAPDCGGGTSYCPSVGCTDTTSDVSNCGGCDKRCVPDQLFDSYAFACNSGTCGCSFVASKCGKTCVSAFWYCPPDGFTGQPADLCKQTARNSYEACACANCLPVIEACFGSASCINSMDCTLRAACPTCPVAFSGCNDQNGALDPIAEKLVSCMNSMCSKP